MANVFRAIGLISTATFCFIIAGVIKNSETSQSFTKELVIHSEYFKNSPCVNHIDSNEKLEHMKKFNPNNLDEINTKAFNERVAFIGKGRISIYNSKTGQFYNRLCEYPKLNTLIHRTPS